MALAKHQTAARDFLPELIKIRLEVAHKRTGIYRAHPVFQAAVKGCRRIKLKRLARAGQGHIQKAPLLLEVLGPCGSVAAGKAILDKIENQYCVPFQALGRMNGGKGDAVLLIGIIVGIFKGDVGHKKIQFPIVLGQSSG